MTNDFSGKLSEDIIRENLKKFSDLNLEQHYDFEVENTSTIKNFESFTEYINKNSPIEFNINDNNELYYKVKGEDVETIFDIDVTKSFSKSDLWLHDKLTSVTEVFPNISSTPISEEQTGFYICLTIASVFKKTFLEDIKEVSSSYDFTNWEQTDSEMYNFSELATSWVQIGSKYVKMVAAAARYSLLREKKKKQIPLALQLPQEKVLKLNKLIREIDIIRFEYDEIQLSDDNRQKMSKLDIKIIIRERDNRINEKLKEDSELYQIWRLMNLNSNVIPPDILLRINREARKSALKMFKNINSSNTNPSSRDERLGVKKIENIFKKNVKRAYLNRLLSTEVEKYLKDPGNYIAPDFV